MSFSILKLTIVNISRCEDIMAVPIWFVVFPPSLIMITVVEGYFSFPLFSSIFKRPIIYKALSSKAALPSQSTFSPYSFNTLIMSIMKNSMSASLSVLKISNIICPIRIGMSPLPMFQIFVPHPFIPLFVVIGKGAQPLF